MKLFPIVARIGDAFETVRAAAAVASAVENRWRPRARDLDRLGISRDALDRVLK